MPTGTSLLAKNRYNKLLNKLREKKSRAEIQKTKPKNNTRSKSRFNSMLLLKRLINILVLNGPSGNKDQEKPRVKGRL